MTALESLSWTATELPMPRPPAPLRLTVARPERHTAAVTVAGELDASTAPRLSEMVLARLYGTLRAVVIDLSEVDFLAAAGISVLVHANLLARHRGIGLRIVTGGNRCVWRALEITGLSELAGP